jgi:hypothetical protein
MGIHDGEGTKVLFRCDQCAHEEWRERDQEPWLCVVCGWMRWQVVDVRGE